MKEKFWILILGLCSLTGGRAAELLLEAESFGQKGGWVVDQQFMDRMGSPYLLAHGLGRSVGDAVASVEFSERGVYHVYVRTYNWTSPWYAGEGPGRFCLSVGGRRLAAELGGRGDCWEWQYAGKVAVRKLRTEVALHDLTGFDGRCDAVYFSTEMREPPAEAKELAAFRDRLSNRPAEPQDAGEYDLVVVGGGLAGMCAAVSAARLGCRVALLNDRPVLGGNNSSEVRVLLGGRIGIGPYPELGNMVKEFASPKGMNAGTPDYYQDERKMDFVKNEPNVTLFLGYRANAVSMEGRRITGIVAQQVESGERMAFRAPVYADCTGDGAVGYLAGADYLMGRESRAQFGELEAPEKPDSMTMGASVQWYSVEDSGASKFPRFEYGLKFSDGSCERVIRGQWTWETGMFRNQVDDFERIRDYGLLAVYSNWSYLKNDLKENGEFRDRRLEWVAYVAGKRESRRLIGDYVLKEDDIRRYVFHEDGTAATSWSIDLHYPDSVNGRYFPGGEFKAISVQIPIHPYPIPYRCFYSRNVDNLFMAGRNISVTHVALGTVRVMRTTGMMGEVVGMAASLCREHGVLPRDIYRYHLDELKALMMEGAGRQGLPNNQTYNMGKTLAEPPRIDLPPGRVLKH